MFHALRAGCALATVASTALAVGPIPNGPATVTFQYTKIGGEVVTLSESRAYEAVGAGGQTPLDGNQSIQYFSSVNTFGRRLVPGGLLHDDESLLAHAFFKDIMTPGGIDQDFFADIDPTQNLTLSVQGITFDEPVDVQEDTIMQHSLYDANQIDQVDPFFTHQHIHHTQTDPFRDFSNFFPLVFSDFPVPNYELGAMPALAITGDGTDTIGLTLTMPYQILQHLEHTDQTQVPSNLPAPDGWLEPFHWHLELAVAAVPEPSTLGLLALAWPLMRRRRR